MKFFKLLSLTVSIILALSSCSTNETLIQEEQATDLLKSYTIKRSADGAYSLDFDFNENVEIEKVVDNETNTNQFYLYSSDSQIRSKGSEELVVDGGELKIGFIDINSNRLPKITITDDNLSSFKAKGNDKEMLSSYSIIGNEDGTFDLDFTVEDEVVVDFVYNEENSIYEIHLEKGNSKEKIFSRNLIKIDGEVLKIDFVNHIKIKEYAKGDTSRESIRRKPRTVIG